MAIAHCGHIMQTVEVSTSTGTWWHTNTLPLVAWMMLHSGQSAGNRMGPMPKKVVELLRKLAL